MNSIKDIMPFKLPNLIADRLILREFEDKDVQDLYEYCSDEDVVGNLSFQTYKNINDAYDRIDFLKAKYAQYDSACWAIELKNEKKVIASIEIFYINKMLKIGYCENKKYWGKGYITEALKCVIQYVFNNNINDYIIGECIHTNIASQSLMKSNGFKHIKTVKNGFNIHGIKYDKYIFKIEKTKK